MFIGGHYYDLEYTDNVQNSNQLLLAFMLTNALVTAEI